MALDFKLPMNVRIRIMWMLGMMVALVEAFVEVPRMLWDLCVDIWRGSFGKPLPTVRPQREPGWVLREYRQRTYREAVSWQ